MIKAPIKPTKTAVQRCTPTFSFNNKEDNNVTMRGETKARANA